MVLLEVILFFVGLFICFFGILLRKPVAGIIGLVWGAGLGAIIALLLSMESDIETEGIVAIIIIIAILMSFLSIKFDRFIASVNSFFAAVGLFFMIGLLTTDADFQSSGIIALIFAIISAGISFKFYEYSFIVWTALLGGFITSLGCLPTLHGERLDEFIGYRVLWQGQGIDKIVLVIFILGIAGTIVQITRKRNESKKEKYNN